MKHHKPSYLNRMLYLLIIVMLASSATAATIYLDPDSVFVTTGVGSEFDLELKVDAATQGIRLFQVSINFDTTLFDTVSTVLGPLFATSGYQTFFNASIGYDSTLGETVLQLRGLLLGPTAVVDGPGTVAIARIITLDTGFADLTILSHVMTDINNDPIESEAEGTVGFIDFFPPDSFDLISPEFPSEIIGFPDSSIQFIWSSSESLLPSEGMVYRLEVSTSIVFDVDSTLVLEPLPDTTVAVPISSLMLDNTYYWRVTAIGDIYGWEQLSSPGALYFYLASPGAPSAFNLLDPASETTVAVVPSGNVMFVWSPSSSPYPGENMVYDLEYSTSVGFEPGVTGAITGLGDANHTVSANDLVSQSWYFWRVTTYGDVYGIERESTPFPDYFFFMIGAEPADFDLLNPSNDDLMNINNVSTNVSFDWEDAASILPDDTITYVLHIGPDPNFAPGSEVVVDSVVDISNLSVSQTLLPIAVQEYWKVVAHNRYGYSKSSSSVYAITFFWRGDLDDSRGIDISDLVYLVDYMFVGGSAPSIMESSDMNCDWVTDISDLVWLVDYMFSGGSAPTCN